MKVPMSHILFLIGELLQNNNEENIKKSNFVNFIMSGEVIPGEGLVVSLKGLLVSDNGFKKKEKSVLSFGLISDNNRTVEAEIINDIDKKSI